IIIRTYNNASTIERAVKSALAQTFKDKEIIVVNDGSKDDIAAILESFGSSIKVVEQENKGAFESGYVGLRVAKGDYVFFLDAG
ncbi:glycosyltransferase family 2 protein, partial [Candidatus Woesearchaeota archaeon]|nr:glycosyltransferase family 2 protein [Candidatus Woesearchaeota archaeon]